MILGDFKLHYQRVFQHSVPFFQLRIRGDFSSIFKYRNLILLLLKYDAVYWTATCNIIRYCDLWSVPQLKFIRRPWFRSTLALNHLHSDYVRHFNISRDIVEWTMNEPNEYNLNDAHIYGNQCDHTIRNGNITVTYVCMLNVNTQTLHGNPLN